MNDIKNKLIKLKDNQLARGATILFIGSFIVNIASYLFNLVVGRMLGPIAYGEFLSLVTIVYLLSIPFAPAQTVVIKYMSQLKTHNKIEEMKQVVIIMTKYVAVVSLIITIILLAATPLLMSALNITTPWLIVLTALTFLAFTPPTILNSAFTGLEKYRGGIAIASSTIILRIILSVACILAGLSVGGVFIAMIISSIIGYIAAWEVIGRYLTQKNKYARFVAKIKRLWQRIRSQPNKETEILKKEMGNYIIPVTIATIGVIAITQIDIILVKIFFSPYEAGIYSSLAIIGKVIPFLSIPLITALFPQLVAKVEKKENFLVPFYAIQGIIIAVSLSIALVYFFLPEMIVTIFFGSKYLDATKYIGIFSLFQVAFTIMNAYVNFFLAIGKNKYAMQGITALIGQIIGITLFHNSITQVIYVSTTVCSLCIIYWTHCTIKIARETKKNI